LTVAIILLTHMTVIFGFV